MRLQILKPSCVLGLLISFQFGLVGCTIFSKKSISDQPTSSEVLGWIDNSSTCKGTDEDFVKGYLSLPLRGIIRDKNLDSYIKNVKTRLISQIPNIKPNIPIYVTLDSSGFRQTFPECAVFISFEFIKNAESEDEIAAVIGHEMSHILIGHFKSDTVFKAIKIMGNLATVGSIFASGGGTLPLLQGLGMIAPATGGEAINSIEHPSWNRDQEVQADLLGVELMVRAGYDYSGATRSLSTYQHPEKEDQKKPSFITLTPINSTTSQIDFHPESLINTKDHPLVIERTSIISNFKEKNHSTYKRRQYRNEEFKALKELDSFKKLSDRVDFTNQFFSGGNPSPSSARIIPKFFNETDNHTFTFELLPEISTTGDVESMSEKKLLDFARHIDAPKFFQLYVVNQLIRRTKRVEAADLFDYINAKRNLALSDYRIGLDLYQSLINHHKNLNQIFDQFDRKTYDSKFSALTNECVLKDMEYLSTNLLAESLKYNPNMPQARSNCTSTIGFQN